jgi:endoglucanase
MGGSAAQAGFGAGGGGATAGAAGSGLSGAAGSSGASDGVDAEAMVAAMGFGANIGNTLENTAEWETGWGQPRITQQFIDGMASRGIKTVRVPVAWDTYADDGVIAPDKLDRVKEVVSWWMESVTRLAFARGIVPVLWDTGSEINRSDGAFSSELQTVLNNVR